MKLKCTFTILIPWSWGPSILYPSGNESKINVLSSAWGSYIKMQRRYILSWKSTSFARYILCKVFLVAQRGPVPWGMIDVIDEQLMKFDIGDNVLANTEFVLNSKLGFVNGYYPNQKENKYEYTYQICFLLMKMGDYIIIYNVDMGSLWAI